ncbi:hypothetical protein CISIN_1g039127mg [Citrus sinensis]|uniref:NB-ARC domain-containing protein n=1 Tax=Citrus sinensis TaxID=2711 RepID=A0A067DEY7_CITSI|nr:hypothetical protein CISIN_1g039127mg [Citrus sinensis]
MLKKIKAVFDDADERQTVVPSVKLWLGREEGTVELVLKDDSETIDGGFFVIPIIGMGGSGNTTPALPVYNDKTVNFNFALDDTWKEKYVDWTNMRDLFAAVASRSKVIVTTRNQGVASIMGTMPAYELKKLVNDNCLLIFSQHPSGTREIVHWRKCLLESVI